MIYHPGMAEWETRVSEHLYWTELDCNDPTKTPYPEEWREDRAIPLAREFEWIRRLLGHKPIVIGSGYRTPEWNRAVGGARNSQHKEGRGLDLYPPSGATVIDVETVVLARARSGSSLIRGIGQYPTFTHIDTRPSPGRLIRWRGGRAWAEVV
jgi:hypothetical protein